MNQNKQSNLWLLAALAAPIAHFSGVGWLTGTITAAVILLLTLLPKNWEDLPRPLAWLEILWLGIVAGLLLPGSADYWPSDNTLVVPLTLLVLALLTNAAAAPRLGAVLAMCAALLSIPVLTSAATRIEPTWLKPSWQPWSYGLALAMLLPSLPAAGQKQKGRTAAYALFLTAAITALVQGVIGSRAAAEVPDPFYQTARTLGHLEPVVASALTLSWYALTCYLLRSASQIAHSCGISRKWADVLVGGTATTLVLFPQQPDARFVSVISLFLWVITPFVTKMNNCEKSEK